MTHRPILFLDLDDVLCLNRPYGGFDVLHALQGRHPEPERVYREVFDEDARRHLKALHAALDGQLLYVISSTWREAMTRQQLAFVFEQADLAEVAQSLAPGAHWCTPRSSMDPDRLSDILAWLEAFHHGGPVAVLDDHHSGFSLRRVLDESDHPLRGRVVLCQEWEGLQEAHVSFLLDALRRPLPAGMRWSEL